MKSAKFNPDIRKTVVYQITQGVAQGTHNIELNQIILKNHFEKEKQC